MHDFRRVLRCCVAAVAAALIHHRPLSVSRNSRRPVSFRSDLRASAARVLAVPEFVARAVVVHLFVVQAFVVQAFVVARAVAADVVAGGSDRFPLTHRHDVQLVLPWVRRHSERESTQPVAARHA